MESQPSRRSLAATARRAWCAALCTLLAVAGAAVAQPPPGFLVESITVEGVQSDAARQIVLFELRLPTGTTYSEPELREAFYRVKRLAFVADAEMELRKGSERGAYVVAILVEAVKPVAFSLEVQSLGAQGYRNNFDLFAVGTVSARKFVGSRGLLFGSVQGFDYSGAGQIYQLGYTQYGLFRPGGDRGVGEVPTALVGVQQEDAELGVRDHRDLGHLVERVVGSDDADLHPCGEVTVPQPVDVTWDPRPAWPVEHRGRGRPRTSELPPAMVGPSWRGRGDDRQQGALAASVVRRDRLARAPVDGPNHRGAQGPVAPPPG